MKLQFRRLAATDFEMVAGWMAAPHVVAWWPDRDDLSAVAAKYGPVVAGDDATEAFVVVADGRDAGFIQRYALADYPQWASAVAVGCDDDRGVGIDYLLGEADLLGTGLGSQMVAAFAASTFDELVGVGSIVVGVQQENAASWRALEAAGFARTWSGQLDSDDASDEGPAFIYVLTRTAAAQRDERLS